MIQAHVKKRLGSFALDAEIADGGFICLLGDNGSGKTTLLRCISGQLTIDDGFVKLSGVDATPLPRHKRGVVTVTPSSYIPRLLVDEHLQWGARLGKVKHSPDYVARVKSELGISFGGRASTLSLGMRERLSLATALLASPKVILVDEAFSNLHARPEFVSSFRNLTNERGVDVVFTTQHEEDVALSDHSYSISEGKTSKRN